MTTKTYLSDSMIQKLDQVDVLVVGGGFGGVCAALSSADAGLKTALVERNYNLGGQAAEIDTWGLDGFISREGHLVVKGYPWKILWETVREGGSDALFERINLETIEKQGIEQALREADLEAYVPYINTGTFMNPFNDQYVNSNAYRYIAIKELQKAGVTLYLGMPVIDVIQDGEKIDGVIVLGEFGKYSILAKRIVDTTQGASVCALSGQVFHFPLAYLGTLPKVANVDIEKVIDYIEATPEDKWFLRPMVGKKADPVIMRSLVKKRNPLAIHGFTKALDKAVRENSEFSILKRMLDVVMFFYEHDSIGAYWAIDDQLHNTNVAEPREFVQAVVDARKEQWLMHKFFVNYVPGFENAQLMDTFPDISKAFHQTFEPSQFTEYEITAEEISSGTTNRDDKVVKILGHPMSGQNAGGWYVPLASLIPKGLDNILVTGKPACRKIHYIASCALVGQAAGAVAAESLIQGKSLRMTDAEGVRNLLRKQDVLI